MAFASEVIKIAMADGVVGINTWKKILGVK